MISNAKKFLLLTKPFIYCRNFFFLAQYFFHAVRIFFLQEKKMRQKNVLLLYREMLRGIRNHFCGVFGPYLCCFTA